MAGALVPGHLMNVASVSCGDGEAQALRRCCHCTPPAPCPVARTEQSCGSVWMQPELSFCTQQPEPRSRSRWRWMRRSTCRSLRMQGENLAPRWIRSIWREAMLRGVLRGVSTPPPASSCPPEPTPGPPEDGRWAGTGCPPASHRDAAAPGAPGGVRRGPGSRLGQGLLPRSWGRGEGSTPRTPPLGSGRRAEPQAGGAPISWPSSYRAGPDPEVFLLDVLDAFIHAFVPQHLPSKARVTQPAAGGTHPAPVPPPAGAEPRFVPPITVPPGKADACSALLHPSPLCRAFMVPAEHQAGSLSSSRGDILGPAVSRGTHPGGDGQAGSS